MDETLEREGKNKSKLQYLRDNQNRNRKTKTTYLRTLNRQEVRAIFMARTRMIQCKRNYKNKYPNMTCMGCGHTEETPKHILEECIRIHETNNTKVTTLEISSEDTGVNRTTADKLIKRRKPKKRETTIESSDETGKQRNQNQLK